jgi:hypothetical protein
MKKHCGYLQEWLEKSWAFQQEPGTTYALEDEPVGGVPGFRSAAYWPNNPRPVFDRRLFPTASEPTMCRYSVPVGYSLEPISLPVYAAYVPMPSEPVSSARRRSNRPVAQTNGLQGNYTSAPPLSQGNWQGHKDARRTSSRLQSGIDSGTNEVFTSLPPAGISHAPHGVHRRFSDPGVRRYVTIQVVRWQNF